MPAAQLLWVFCQVKIASNDAALIGSVEEIGDALRDAAGLGNESWPQVIKNSKHTLP